MYVEMNINYLLHLTGNLANVFVDVEIVTEHFSMTSKGYYSFGVSNIFLA